MCGNRARSAVESVHFACGQKARDVKRAKKEESMIPFLTFALIVEDLLPKKPAPNWKSG